MTPKATVSAVIPAMRYRDAAKAIDWLCDAFGFERHAVHPGDDGTIVHAELRFGNGMIMLSSIHDNEFSRLMKQPDEIGGAETQTAYLIVEDADAHYEREGCRRRDRHGDQDRRLWRSRLFLPGPGGAYLELRHLRPLGRFPRLSAPNTMPGP